MAIWSKGVCPGKFPDRISDVEDDLSHLTFSEATKLDFDGTKSLLKLRTAEKYSLELEEERCNFVRWVYSVLASHAGSAIDEFRVIFDLNRAYEKSIEEWLRFVLARKVQKLELNLINDFSWCGGTNGAECYTLPFRLVFFDSSCDFNFLRKLSLNYVNVNGEVLEILVRKCPLLEHLSVSYSVQLTNLRIVGPFPSLKCLEVRWCRNLKSIEVRDANLVGLTYVGPRIEFVLENVPLLVEMFIGGDITEEMRDILLALGSYLPRLEILSISRTYFFDIYSEETEQFYSTVKMSKLKQLRVLVGVEKFDDKDFSLMWVTNLIRASPCLERFVLEVLRYDPPRMIASRMLENIETPHMHLKEVKFVGYCGNTSDFELVVHFLKNAPLLEKLVVDPSQPCESLPLPYECVDEFKFPDEESKARSRAEIQFSYVTLPPRIDFQIL